MSFSVSRSLLLTGLCTTALFAQATDLTSAKAGMRQRVAEIDTLKASGAVGEGHTGLLVARVTSEHVEQVTKAENADRQIVFAELAKQSGGTAANVAKSFAAQIATASKPGVWLQREDGTWYKK